MDQLPKPAHEEPIIDTHKGRKQLFISLFVLLILLLSTLIVVLYGTGYRLGFQQGRPLVSKTGILAANSQPKGAQVFLNGHLTTATDTNINLTPGRYTLKIVKDGYFPWEKEIFIQEKEVTQVDAMLFPIAPKLEAITNIGVDNPVLDPTRSKIAFTSATQTFKKNGIYIYDMTANIVPLQPTLRQIVDDTFDTFSKATIIWSPDGQELIASIAATASRNQTYYLLKTQGFNDSPKDITAVLTTVMDTWQNLKEEKENARLASLKKPVQTLIKDYFEIISWSPDNTKILYRAKQSLEIPLIIIPRRLSITNAIAEERNIKKGGIYVYNIGEDLNTKLFDNLSLRCEADSSPCLTPLRWHSDSNHLIFVDDKRIEAMYYDGSNRTTLYAGPFLDHFVFSWPDGSQIVILTNLNNPSIPANLYTVSLK